MIVRSGESHNNWFRSERFYDTHEGWFFVTRENTQQGPYRSENEAKVGLQHYIDRIERQDILTGL